MPAAWPVCVCIFIFLPFFASSSAAILACTDTISLFFFFLSAGIYIESVANRSKKPTWPT